MMVNDLIHTSSAWSDAASEALVLDRSRTADAERMNHLIASRQARHIHDTLAQQVDDLVRVRARRADIPADELRVGRQALLGGADPAEYGRWVFYPWSARLVHVLPPAEFAELRLHRNRHQVTAPEQLRLAGFNVGIVGLTTGNAVALTLALEGAAGHLKLADDGPAALGDLNRLRGAVHDLGVPRTVLAARQVAEVDPYARLTLFHEGLTEENAGDFLGGDVPLHAVVDACGDLRARVLLRQRARAAGIPVLAAGGDRGAVEVERYDLEPRRALFHGRAGEITPERVRRMSAGERLAVELAVADAERASPRTAASLVELRSTVLALPRMASDAALGGAAVAMAVRRLALGQPLPSGRRHLDPHAVLEDRGATVTPISAAPGWQPGRALGGVDGRIPELVSFCVRHGILAPSAANRQPWRFSWDGERLWVMEDRARSASLLDPHHRAAHVALGAAVENIAVAAAHRGYRVRMEPFPRPREPQVAAALTFERADADPADASLFPHLAERVTNRRTGKHVPLGADAITALADAARVRGARLDLVTDEPEIAELASLLGAGERIRQLTRELHREMMGELRWSAEEAAREGRGVPVDALELNPAQRAALRVAQRPDVAATLRELGGGRVLQERVEKAVLRSSAVGLVTVGGGAAANALRGGRAVERVWLRATALGLAFEPVTSLIHMFEMLDGSAATMFSSREREELRALRARFDAVYQAAQGGTRLLLFRLGVAGAPSARAPRMPLEAVLAWGRPAMAA
ncbi:MAG TPA: Rv1355c family protein [Longimicrobium sp.]|nr:Rv1355c family protein [Longimicrobium sp.]